MNAAMPCLDPTHPWTVIGEPGFYPDLEAEREEDERWSNPPFEVMADVRGTKDAACAVLAALGAALLGAALLALVSL